MGQNSTNTQIKDSDVELKDSDVERILKHNVQGDLRLKQIETK